ncbi:CDP-glycerol glycerophosphotransferase family protein [Aurantibacter aestuarii]|uniref:CDP-glycerol--glycerophosphate glycerophosphotransferase n=1 Tax=Aurantibacter aestuarii TaxID=1266046 RepID=A0A2T1N9V1_9FLAO|nr:CDP-glycerol glycerophosphotransferase family protein [Aurantibacter aestuarii]PSG88650.1 CDP-glycerol--glycerophosphate glycerophosphotransferase [Aurantibacter aestuarii]
MKFVLFCLNNYAFAILEPIKKELQNLNYDFLWYVAPKISADFPFKQDQYTSSILKIKSYNPEVIFAPGNEVPYFLRGLKTQIFHGLAGEKKGHFRIRNYFDLYLTQGPYFTKKFNELKKTHNDFDVIETGWPKLDIYGKQKDKYHAYKKELLTTYNANTILLYAPTFSPKLTSAPFLINEIKNLAKKKNFLILLKFHPLMAKEWIDTYKKLAKSTNNILFQEEKDITKFLLISDVLISDTSSVIYEFMLLDKPVITFKNISSNIIWENSLEYNNLNALIDKTLLEDVFSKNRTNIIENYHPYQDGQSAKRMVEAVVTYLKDHKVPSKRNISFFRKLKTHLKLLKANAY